METDRRKEVINICLDTFIKRGLSQTSVRDLSKALNLQSGGIYYYFNDKDDAVVACAEEAAMRLETNLILPALKEIRDPDTMVSNLLLRSNEMRPTMRFFTSVCSLSKYEQQVKPILIRMVERFDRYSEKMAANVGCESGEVRPFLYMTVTAISNYMIFGEDSYIFPQMDILRNAIVTLKR